jgi:hypothetical protein
MARAFSPAPSSIHLEVNPQPTGLLGRFGTMTSKSHRAGAKRKVFFVLTEGMPRTVNSPNATASKLRATTPQANSLEITIGWL